MKTASETDFSYLFIPYVRNSTWSLSKSKVSQKYLLPSPSNMKEVWKLGIFVVYKRLAAVRSMYILYAGTFLPHLSLQQKEILTSLSLYIFSHQQEKPSWTTGEIQRFLEEGHNHQKYSRVNLILRWAQHWTPALIDHSVAVINIVINLSKSRWNNKLDRDVVPEMIVMLFDCFSTNFSEICASLPIYSIFLTKWKSVLKWMQRPRRL